MDFSAASDQLPFDLPVPGAMDITGASDDKKVTSVVAAGFGTYDRNLEEWESVMSVQQQSDSIAPWELERRKTFRQINKRVAISSDCSAVRTKPAAIPGTRPNFSQNSVHVLRSWLVANSHHPYPSHDKEMLGKVTGLDETQIDNWFANARRRSKVGPGAPRMSSLAAHGDRGTTTTPEQATSPIDVPTRSVTSGIFERWDPLQRW
jgi:hypothetical protein